MYRTWPWIPSLRYRLPSPVAVRAGLSSYSACNRLYLYLPSWMRSLQSYCLTDLPTFFPLGSLFFPQSSSHPSRLILFLFSPTFIPNCWNGGRSQGVRLTESVTVCTMERPLCLFVVAVFISLWFPFLSVAWLLWMFTSPPNPNGNDLESSFLLRLFSGGPSWNQNAKIPKSQWSGK